MPKRCRRHAQIRVEPCVGVPVSGLCSHVPVMFVHHHFPLFHRLIIHPFSRLIFIRRFRPVYLRCKTTAIKSKTCPPSLPLIPRPSRQVANSLSLPWPLSNFGQAILCALPVAPVTRLESLYWLMRRLSMPAQPAQVKIYHTWRNRPIHTPASYCKGTKSLRKQLPPHPVFFSRSRSILLNDVNPIR
jgi:hypothetical protein